MTPMIDVVFLLIIFFLVSSHLARQASRLPLELPVAATHRDLNQRPDVMTVNVTPAGQWQVNTRAITVDDLPRLLSRHRQEHGDDALLRIRTTGSVPYRQVEPLLRLAAENGIWNLSFAVNEST